VPPADHHTILRWSGNDLQPVDDAPGGALLAADSWLVEDGAVRGYDLHWERFGGWCAELEIGADVLAPLRAAVTAALPRSGRWFPRLDAIGSSGGRAGAAHVLLRLRPAAPAQPEARVLLPPHADLRGRPRWKGPDLALLLALRARAIAADADEILLCDGDGRLVEGALHSLLWWEDDVLCTTPEQRTLPGITRALLLAIALERGVALRVRSPLPEELTGRETWLVNAAHGIRAVTAWGPGPAAPAPRAAAWRDALGATARSLDGP
jgi:branched-subunit amino acid aminotransferase/4-amino-4-deoxychorismate lyase